MRTTGRSRSGLTIAVVLMVLMLMFIIAQVMTSLSVGGLARSSEEGRSEQALWAANAGIEAALAQLGANPTWTTGFGTTSLPNNQGYYTVTVTPGPGTSANNVFVPSGYVYLLATGAPATSGTAPTTLSGMTTRHIGVLVTNDNPFVWCLFGRNSLQYQATGAVDSWDSGVGPYSTSHSTNASNVKVGTNGTAAGALTVHNGATIYGGAAVGPGGSVGTTISASAGAITGTKTVLSSPVNFTMPTAPPGPVGGAVTTAGTLAPGNYSSLTLSSGTLTLSAGTYYFANGVTLSGSAQIQVPSTVTGPVKVYFGNSFSVPGNATCVNLSHVPGNLQIYGTATATNFHMTTNVDSYFAADVPNANADFEVVNNTPIYGGIICNTLTEEGGMDFHYDMALSRLSGVGAIKVVSWQRQ